MRAVQKPIEADKHDQIIRNLINGTKVAYTQLCESVYKIKRHKLYDKLGYNSFTEYLSSPEIALPRSTAYRMAKYWEVFILDLQIPRDELEQMDSGKLMQVVTVITGENKDEWLEKVKALSKRDLNIEVKEAKSGIKPEDCEHQDYYRRHCTECGRTEKFNP